MSPKTAEEKGVNLGFVIITYSELDQKMHSSVIVDVVSCSCGCRKYFGKMHIPRPQEKKTQNYYKITKQTEITTRATFGSPSNNDNKNILQIRLIT